MAKIPFDVKCRPQIESGEYKVETRDGTPVEIVKWDCRSPHGEAPILAILHGDYDYNRTYSLEGYSTCDSDRLYLITPVPELNELEQAVKDLCWKVGILGEVFYKDDIIKKTAAELLDIARKEIIGEWSKGLRDTQDLSGKAYSDGYNFGSKFGYERGKAEALKDLPRWRKWGNGACGNGRGIPIALVVRGLNGYELVDSLGIQGEQYIMLSDLEKLHGFKED